MNSSNELLSELICSIQLVNFVDMSELPINGKVALIKGGYAHFNMYIFHF